MGVQESELKRGLERAELAEKNLKSIEEELETVGENMKQLEKSAEKALEREEKLVEKILSLQNKYKITEARFEYGEMNITKLNQRIDDIEDEIYREKLKIKSVPMSSTTPSMTCLPTTNSPQQLVGSIEPIRISWCIITRKKNKMHLT